MRAWAKKEHKPVKGGEFFSVINDKTAFITNLFSNLLKKDEFLGLNDK